MGSGGEELLCEQELKWGDRGSKSRMKTGREREREGEEGGRSGGRSFAHNTLKTRM